MLPSEASTLEEAEAMKQYFADKGNWGAKPRPPSSSTPRTVQLTSSLPAEGMWDAASISAMPILEDGCVSCAGALSDTCPEWEERQPRLRGLPSEEVDLGRVWSPLKGGVVYKYSTGEKVLLPAHTAGPRPGNGRNQTNSSRRSRFPYKVRSRVSCCGMAPPESLNFSQFRDLSCDMSYVQVVSMHPNPDEWEDTLVDATEDVRADGRVIWPVVVRTFGAPESQIGTSFLGMVAGMDFWPYQVSLAVEATGDSYVDSLLGKGDRPCTRVVNDRIGVIVSDPYTGGIWHDFHNILIRTFGALAEREDGIVTCNVEWPEGCRIQRDKVELLNYYGVESSPNLLRFMSYLSDKHPRSRSSLHGSDGTCYSKLLAGISTSLNFNSARTTPRTAALLTHFQRWFFFQETGTPIDLLPLEVDTTREKPHVLIIARRGYARRWLDNDEYRMLDWLEDRGLEGTVIEFEEISKREIAQAMREATIIIAVSGAALMNTIDIYPGTVVFDLFPRKFFKFELPEYFIFAAIVNARGGTIINWEDHRDAVPGDFRSTLPIRMTEEMFHAILDQSLQLGIHKHMDVTWKWSTAPPLDTRIVVSDPDFSAKLAQYPGRYLWPPASTAT